MTKKTQTYLQRIEGIVECVEDQECLRCLKVVEKAFKQHPVDHYPTQKILTHLFGEISKGILHISMDD